MILPKELPTKLGAEIRDLLAWLPDGDGFVVRRNNAGSAEQIAAAREVTERRCNALRELAK